MSVFLKNAKKHEQKKKGRGILEYVGMRHQEMRKAKNETKSRTF